MCSPTRGRGLLEGVLARKRAALATRLLATRVNDVVLDIGCGSDPLFLKRLHVAQRVAFERFVPRGAAEDGIVTTIADAAGARHLPFKNDSFDRIAMLAVLEHLPPHAVAPLLAEVHRILTPGGAFVVTTPPPWTDAILPIFARLRLVSKEEIEEHARAYTKRELTSMFAQSPFRGASVGTFELGMNLWARAIKAERGNDDA